MRPEAYGLFDPGQEIDACGVGFIVRIDGKKSHDIVTDAITALCNLEHRGAVGGDMKTGDGAGLMVQIPHTFFKKVLPFSLPEVSLYGAGFIFLPPEPEEAIRAMEMTGRTVLAEGGMVLGWRPVPVNQECLGEQAQAEMPAFYQLFLEFPGVSAGGDYERRLYILRKCLENSARNEGWGLDQFYISSLSSRTMVYKGMFVSTQFLSFYPDLEDEDFESSMAMFHQRYSTNTFPSWFLAQPFRMIAHNGEINTLRRNFNNMRAREKTISSPLFGSDIEKIRPVALPDTSDSAVFDNVLELLIQGGRSIDHSLIMMMPEAFGSQYHISEDKRAFLEYHAAIMEPWDGPAAVAFCDGERIGAILDRNGLRPGRYIVTRDHKVILSSETGVLDVDPALIIEKGRLSPGKLFYVDTVQGRIIRDNEIKAAVSRRKPYRHWLEKNRIQLKGLLGIPRLMAPDREKTDFSLRSFGYTREDMKTIIAPMIVNSQEPVGSMGNDSAPAVLSDRPQLVYNYFKQLFAQVTNPPIDPYRENLVMSLMSFVGRERNLLAETPEHCRQLKLSHPVLTNDDIDLLRGSSIPDYRVATVPILFDSEASPGEMKKALEKVCREVEARVDEGHSMVILSDRGIDRRYCSIPGLIAVGGVHHHLVRQGKRHLTGLVIETGEAREVHHFACLIGYGASGINPYLVFESIQDMQKAGYIDPDLPEQEAVERYAAAVKKGILKVMSKMGVSTLRSYRGAQIFEALGIGPDLIDQCFTGTASLIGGIGFDEVERERLELHIQGCFEYDHSGRGDGFSPLYSLNPGGRYSSRRDSESHLFSPEAVALLQKSTREGSYSVFKKYTSIVNAGAKNICTLRGLFSFTSVSGNISEPLSVPLEEVEPEEEIVKRFVSSAMSFGSISREAHETIAIAFNRLGGRSNSGEGGEDFERYLGRNGSGDRNSKIKQIASARFGVTSEYLISAEELQIKMAQGAKPGEGGQLPGHKVDEMIARVRHSTPGVMLISPPPHHDIYSIEDLAQLIYDLKAGNPKARVSVKLVSETGVGTVAAGVAKGKADTVLISGGDGGTGASPLSSILHTGTPWEIGLSETHQVLTGSRLRDKIRVQVDGQIKTGRDIVIAALLGAEEFGFATTLLVCLGCVMMRKCHLNTCPVGVATQDPRLRELFRGKADYIVNFLLFLAREVREYMAELGYRSFDQMIGQSGRLAVNPEAGNYKARTLDFSRILVRPPGNGDAPEDSRDTADAPGRETLDTVIIQRIFPGENNPGFMEPPAASVKEGSVERVGQEYPIRNSDRAVGATVSSVISRKYGLSGLPEDSVKVKFTGSAGQSFGAFLAAGVTFELEGDANDYFCKGLSGGKVIVYPPKNSPFAPERNIITGNVNLFGATSGEVYINGRAGERFCVRNSGATAVVEGLGDHGCEYMTGGRVIVLGETGINFAAGMSGGIAYVLDRNQLFDTRCNLEMVDIEPPDTEDDLSFLKTYIENHIACTGSPAAKRIMDLWEETFPLFVKIIPIDYRAAMERMKERALKEPDSANITEEVYN